MTQPLPRPHIPSARLHKSRRKQKREELFNFCGEHVWDQRGEKRAVEEKSLSSYRSGRNFCARETSTVNANPAVNGRKSSVLKETGTRGSTTTPKRTARTRMRALRLCSWAVVACLRVVRHSKAKRCAARFISIPENIPTRNPTPTMMISILKGMISPLRSQ